MDDKEVALKIVLKLIDKKLIKDLQNPAKEISEAYRTILKTILEPPQADEFSDVLTSLNEDVSASLKTEEQ